jgi:hypothetical protein
MSLGEEADCAPFSLADEEDADIVAVASSLVALSRLRIIPSIPPETVLGDWTLGGMGVGRLTPFAASARASCSRGGGLYLRPSPMFTRSLPFPRLREGGGGGGSGGRSGAMTQWSPSTDRHAHGEPRRFPLVLVRNDGEEFCLGCIGVDERCFCWSTECNVMSHCK